MNDEFKNDGISDEQDKTALQKIREWTQENLRIIISVLVVFLIASSIYSYSKRGDQKTDVANKNNEVEKILGDLSSDEKDKSADITDKSATDTAETSDNSTTADSTADTPKEQSADTTTETTDATPTPEKKTPEKTTEKIAANKAPSQETENSFIETASQGDGITKLARKALAHYLEKNPDSTLTPEHKIYIEDYLRKNVNFHEKVYVGTSVEFSKNLIKDAIDASKGLNDNQLNNLHKYAVNVQF